MTRRAERILWGLAFLGGFAVIAGWRFGTPAPLAPQLSNLTRIPEVQTFNESHLTTGAERIIEYNPFRLNRSPSTVPFGTPDMPSQPASPSPPSPFASLTLKGIVGGPPWRAVLGGVPGWERNVVVSAGDTIAGFRIKRVRSDSVVIAGKDSVVTFTLQRVWR